VPESSAKGVSKLTLLYLFVNRITWGFFDDVERDSGYAFPFQLMHQDENLGVHYLEERGY
jgi:hypothetical protein